MNFAELEKTIRNYISHNKVKESIDLLLNFFEGDSEMDEITLQSARYHAILDKEMEGSADRLEIDVELNSLRSNILKILKSKKEYLKYKELNFGGQTHGQGNHEGLIRVFFSLASPHNDEQQNYINKLSAYFKENGILLGPLTSWNEQDPLLPILEELKNSSGCLVLALERYYINDGVTKRGSDQEDKIINQSSTSPWLHIETALARSLNLPLIIFKDDTLINEGVIHNDKQEWGVVRIDPSNLNAIEQYPIKNFILSWINQVKRYHHTKNGN